LTGFTPNSSITVHSSYSETVCADGQHVSSSWTGNAGTTDNNGSTVFGVIHQGTGNYNYTFSDQAGHSSSSSFNTTGCESSNNGASSGTSGDDGTSTSGTRTNDTPVVISPSSSTNSQPPLVSGDRPDDGQWVRIIADAGMNIRSGPSLSYPRIARTTYGTYFELIETRSGWHHIRWNNGDGWVSGNTQWTQLGSSEASNNFDDDSLLQQDITNHGNGWCSAVPAEVGYFGLHGFNPRYEMHFPPEVNLNGPPEHYIYYNGEWVGWVSLLRDYVASFTGWNHEENMWIFGINSKWVGWQLVQFNDWANPERWRVDYRCD
jgi:hypothetical protein